MYITFIRFSAKAWECYILLTKIKFWAIWRTERGERSRKREREKRKEKKRKEKREKREEPGWTKDSGDIYIN